MKIYRVKDPGAFKHALDGQIHELKGIFYLLAIDNQQDLEDLPKEIVDRMRKSWSQVFRHSKQRKKLEYFFRDKKRWALLVSLTKGNDFTAKQFIGFVLITQPANVKIFGKSAYDLISLIFRSCFSIGWKYESNEQYRIERIDHHVKVSVPPEKYAPLMGNNEYAYQSVLELFLKVDLILEIESPF